MEEMTDIGGLGEYTNCEGRGRIEKLYLINRVGYTLGLDFIDGEGAGLDEEAVCLYVVVGDTSIWLGVFDAEGSACVDVGFIDEEGSVCLYVVVADTTVCMYVGVVDAVGSGCLGVGDVKADTSACLGVGAAVIVMKYCDCFGDAEAVGHANA